MPAQSHNQLASCKQALEANGFEVFSANSPAEAKALFFASILPMLNASTASWGDSMTLQETGIIQELLTRKDLEVIKTFEKGVEQRELLERRRQALLADLFLTGSNAVTKDGKIVNLDMIGNRTAPISFGPKRVVLFIGRNKITQDLNSAMARIRDIAAPQNARRHRLATPCAKTNRCGDCSSPQRICNNWSIISKCFPPQRIKVILIDADLGL